MSEILFKIKDIIIRVSLLKKVIGIISGKFPSLSRSAANALKTAGEEIPDEIATRMIRYWCDELGVTERTAQDWLAAAFNYQRYRYDVQQIKERFGDLSGKRIADIGCGWGSFLSLLSKEGAQVQACDIAAIHAEIAQKRVPEATVLQADARKLIGFESESFDIVLEHDVFEHIGDYSGDTGPLGRTYGDKLQNLLEIRRIMKKDGRGFLSTGNYSFPFNGEVQVWFLHWLPYEYQQRYLKSLDLNSDRYWLCTWDQLRKLFDDAGLIIDEVYTPPHDVDSFKIAMMAFLARDKRFNQEFEHILGELMLKHPDYMPSWMIFFSKKP